MLKWALVAAAVAVAVEMAEIVLSLELCGDFCVKSRASDMHKYVTNFIKGNTLGMRHAHE